ncbi:MAG: arylsulfatase [Acidobacteria bacterium]|nr:arylsulfatase [Acidobacteriota bacterium]
MIEYLNRRQFLASSTGALIAAQQRPNVVYILADDMGYGDPGFLNAKSRIPTPNLDRLATQSMRFTDAHSPSAVCSPTRYGILTGRYPFRSRLKKGVIPPWGKTLIEEGRLTVPAMLKRHGYNTAAIGKWHLGWQWPTPVDFSRPIPGGPTTRGFDTFFGVDAPNYPPFCYIDNDRTVGIPTEAIDRDKLEAEARGRGFGWQDLGTGPKLKDWDLVNILPELTNRAVKYIEDRSAKPEPFFLYFALTGPHTPIVPAPQFQGKSKAGPYGDLVHQVDWTVGQVLDALDRTGQTRNTLVVFTSDNGPEWPAYDRARDEQHYSMGQWRGIKRDLWEGGHRVPFLVRWPGHVKAGSVSNEVISHVDLMATLAAILGEKLSADAGEDSYSILPALQGKKRMIREATVLSSISGYLGLRQGDWVLLDHKTGDDNGGKEPAWRNYEPHSSPGELYNLKLDPAQRKNLYAQEPARVAAMKSLLEKYKREGRSIR